jgi:hypothetical protein
MTFGWPQVSIPPNTMATSPVHVTVWSHRGLSGLSAMIVQLSVEGL